MAPEVQFRTDLYRGTAAFYDRCRRPYPDALFDDLRSRLPVSGKGRLLDLGCGTGQIARRMAADFEEVVAIDQERESVAFGEAQSSTEGLHNITWLAGAAESVDLKGPFELVAIGNAFQRLNRPLVADRLRTSVQPGGGVALLWSQLPWEGHLPWQQTLFKFFIDWIAEVKAADRVPSGFEEAMTELPHEAVLTDAGYIYGGRFEFGIDHHWTVEALTGFFYSTSLLNKEAVGERAAAFEDDLARRMLAVEPSGAFHERATDAYELATLPGRA